ncbi:hypothetical protein EV121DRAFT_202371 [Schizophyllum commune]
MGLKSLPHSEWFELDNEYATYQRIRRARIESKGREILRIIPSDKVGDGTVVRGERIAQGVVELLLATAEYLAQRYPESFTLDSKTRTITNRVLGETHQLPTSIWADEKYGILREVSLEEGEAALRTCALLQVHPSHNVPDDLALLTEGADGKYYLQGGAILVPGTWRLREKLGMKLEDIHVEGKVPRYEQALRPSMDRYFARLAVDKPVVRVNYGVQVLPSQPSVSSPTTNLTSGAVDDPDELAWAATTMGEEFPDESPAKDDHDIANGVQPESNGDLRRHAQTAEVRPERLRLRVERQTLRRLPGTGIIVFGIRTYRYLISDIKDEVEDGATTATLSGQENSAPPSPDSVMPGKEQSTTPEKEKESVGARLASALRSWPDDVRRYKGGHTWGDTVIEYLESRSS